MLTSSMSHAVLSISPSRLLSCPHSRVSLPIAPWCCMSVVLVSEAVPAAGQEDLNPTNMSCSLDLNAHSASSDLSLACIKVSVRCCRVIQPGVEGA